MKAVYNQDTTITLPDGQEIDATVYYRYYSGRRQTYWEPAEEASCEVESVVPLDKAVGADLVDFLGHEQVEELGAWLVERHHEHYGEW